VSIVSSDPFALSEAIESMRICLLNSSFCLLTLQRHPSRLRRRGQPAKGQSNEALPADYCRLPFLIEFRYHPEASEEFLIPPSTFFLSPMKSAVKKAKPKKVS
jgi:hypothetical protein